MPRGASRRRCGSTASCPQSVRYLTDNLPSVNVRENHLHPFPPRLHLPFAFFFPGSFAPTLPSEHHQDMAGLRPFLLACITAICMVGGIVYGDQSASKESLAEATASRTSSVPLHERIDELIEEDAIGPLAPLCSDADLSAVFIWI